MTKERQDIKEWQRALVKLSRLDGQLVHLDSGAVLIANVRVRDPAPLLECCQQGQPPTHADLDQALQLDTRPLPVSASFLASAHRDLRALEGLLNTTALKKSAPRVLRRYGRLDKTWVQERRERLA